VETAVVLPILIALLMGTVDLARITYTYYMLQKITFDLARYIGTQQGVDFCNSQDAELQAALNYALTGTTDASGSPIVPGLTASMFQVRIERYDPSTGALSVCDCSATGCDTSQGGLPPDFIVVSMNQDYLVHPLFWGFSIDPFPLRPSVRVPNAGT